MPRKSGEKLMQLPCVTCGGRGYSSCMVCGGNGYTLISKSRMRYDRSLEFYQERLPCTGCFSSGRITCLSCKGVGWVLQSGPSRAGVQPGRVPAPTKPVAPEPQPELSTPFPFQPYEFVYHPADQKVWACWQHNPGNCLDIGTGVGGSVRIELTASNRDTWLTVRDGSGNPVPLAIFVGSSGELLGRWL